MAILRRSLLVATGLLLLQPVAVHPAHGGARGTGRIITAHLVLDGSRHAQVSVVEGAVLTISTPSAGKIGLVPRVAGDVLEVRVLEIQKDPAAGTEKQVELGVATVSMAEETRIVASPVPMSFTWLGTLAPPPEGREPLGPCTRCCVTCEGFTVCGCHIVLNCGSCCCPDTCSCDDRR
jgi:hypothetical protein